MKEVQLVISPGGDFSIGGVPLHLVNCIPDGECVSVGWSFNSDIPEFANVTQGEFVITFGAARGYYWPHDIAGELTTIEGWIQAPEDSKLDLRGLKESPDHPDYQFLLDHNYGLHSRLENQVPQNIPQDQVLDSTNEALMPFIGEFKQSLIQMEAYMRRDAMTWESDDVRQNWIDQVNATDSPNALGALMVSYIQHIHQSHISWENGYHPEHSAKLTSDNVKITDLVSVLLSLECSIYWSGVIDQFRQDRPTWTGALRDFPAGLVPAISSNDQQNEVVRKALLDFDEFMRSEYMAWNGEEEHQTWRIVLTHVETLPEIAQLAQEFISKISSQVKSADPESITANAVDQLSPYDLAIGLLSLETNISWDGVTDAFRDARNLWIKPLRILRDHIEQQREEQKRAALGDLTSQEIGLRLLKEGLVQFEAYMHREVMNWLSDDECQAWRNELVSAQSTEDIGRLLIRFVAKIAPGSIFGWENGIHPELTRKVLSNGVHAGTIAEVLLSIETSVPWSAVIVEFSSARSDWRHPLETLSQTLSQEAQQTTSVLTTVKNALIALEGYIIRNAMTWESPQSRSIWITNVLQSETVSDLGRLMYEFVSKISRESFFSTWAETGKQNTFHAKLLHPDVKIQTLIQLLVNIESSISWSAVVPIFRNERNSWLTPLVNLPQYNWPEDNTQLDLAALSSPELPALNRSANIRASLRNSTASRKTGRVCYDHAPKNAVELISPGNAKSYVLHTALAENDCILANLHIQSVNSEDLEFYVNFVSDNGENILRIKFDKPAHNAGVVECYSFTHAGQSLIPGATSDSWNNTFPFTVGQDFELGIIVIDDSTLSLTFDGVFTIDEVSTYPHSVEDIHRITLVAKAGRVLSKNINFKFTRSVQLIPE